MAALPLLGLLGLAASVVSGAEVPVNEDGYPLVPADDYYVADPAGNDEVSLLSRSELETLVGPVALYPDDLLAIVLPASTYPLEIVQAARFLEDLESDSSLEPDEDWDDSVVALLNYPEVVKLMNDDLDWTWSLGEAVVAQQSDVIAAIESFRDRAYTAGNLKSDEYQTVTRNDSVIEIRPVREEVIYVPYYEPERVVVYSPRPVYYYYPRPYPLYYYPYASDHYFASGYFWGLTTAFSIGWASDYLHVYHHSYRGHRYYGHSYYGHHYRRPSIHVYNNYYVNHHRHRPYNHHRNGDYWRPRHQGGARPGRHVARNNYYRDGGRNRPHSGNRGSGNRNDRAQRANGPNRNAPPRNSRPRTDIAARPGIANRNARQPGHRRSTPVIASGRSSSRLTNRSNSSPRKRPAVAFRSRPDNRQASSVSPGLDRGRSNPPRRSANRAPERRKNPDAVRLRARERATTPRIATRDSEGSAPARRSVQHRSSRPNAYRGYRSSSAPSTRRSIAPATNRQTRAHVSAPPRPSTVRSRSRPASYSRPATNYSRPPSRPPQRRSSGPSRSTAYPSSSGRKSPANSSSSSRGGRGAYGASRGGRGSAGPNRGGRTSQGPGRGSRQR